MELKFRGLTAKCEFVYGLLSEDLPNSTFYYDGYSFRICWNTVKGGRANCPVKNGTVGQFTGLTDKNGKDIYLGDVVKASGEYPAEIIFNFGSFLLRHISHVGYNGISISDVATDRYEVIGNIHQHPELMDIGNNND